MGANPYEMLANDIVEQAAKDWRGSMKRLRKNPFDRNAQLMKVETEDFFRSGWFKVLTAVDGEHLLAQLKGEFA